MAHTEEELIRERAYALWEAEGKPEGRHDAHWEQAHNEISGRDLTEETSVLGEPDEAEPAQTPPSLSVVDSGRDAPLTDKRKRKTA